MFSKALTRAAMAAVTLLAASLAHGQTYDVSGHDGVAGRDGYNRGGDGSDGAPAGRIAVEVGFVPGSGTSKIFVKGQVGERQVNDIFMTSAVRRLQFIANGGRGGDGGPGRPGESGRDGSDGRDGSAFGFNLSGSNGYDGSDGTDGLDGGNGGNGGNAGRISVRLARGSEILAPLISLETEPGLGGDYGRGGEGGRGGRGGRGGSGACDYGNTSMDITKSFHPSRCGSDGYSGSSGRDGSDGRQGQAGSAGARGFSQFVDASGAQTGVYNLAVTRMDVRETIPDGIFEPEESVDVYSITLTNNGSAAVPAAEYVLDVAGNALTQSVGALAAGAQLTLSYPRAVTVAADRLSGRMPVRLTLSSVNTSLGGIEGVMTGQPIKLSGLRGPMFTNRQKESQISIEVTNISQGDYGARGKLGRAVKLIIEPDGSSSFISLKMQDGSTRALNHPLAFDVPLVSAGHKYRLHIPATAVGNIPLGSSMPFHVKLEIDGGTKGMKTTEAQAAAAYYGLDSATSFDYVADVKADQIICEFDQRWFSHRKLAMIKLKKAKDSDKVQVQFRLNLAWSDSPIVNFEISEVDFLLEDILHNRKPSLTQVLNLMNGPIFNHSGRWGFGKTDIPEKWQIWKCEAPNR